MANDFTDVGFFGFEEQESVPSQAQQEEDREHALDAIARVRQEAALAQATPVPEQHQQSYDHDTDMLARLAIAEGGREGPYMQLPINVAWNRAFDSKAKGVVPGGGSGNLESVVTPENQFTSYNTDQYNYAHQHPRWDEALQLAQAQLKGELFDMSAGNLFYRNPDTSTSDWFQDKVDEGVLVPHDYRTGRHTVYRHEPKSPDPQIARDAIAKSQAERDALFEAEPAQGPLTSSKGGYLSPEARAAIANLVTEGNLVAQQNVVPTFPTTGGLSELDRRTRTERDIIEAQADKNYLEQLAGEIPTGIFYDDPFFTEKSAARIEAQLEDILKAETDQGPWSPASGPRYAPLSTAIGTDPTLGPTREDIFGVPRATDLTTPSPLSTIMGTADMLLPEPVSQSGMLAPEPRPLIYTDAVVPQARDRTAEEAQALRTNQIMAEVPALINELPYEGENRFGLRPAPVVPQARDRAAEAAQAERAIIEAQADQDYFDQLSDGHILGRWREQTGKPTDERYFAQAPGSMEWTGRGGLSELDIGNLLKQGAIALGTAGVGNLLGLKKGVTPALRGLKHYLNKYFTDDIKGSELLVEEPWEGWETGGEDQMAQGGLISLAHGGNPSVYQAGENIEKLLATKMGYEGNKYSGVPNQQGMINTVNQGIGDNVKSGLRSIVANAYAQGNVPAPSVPQYNQAQLLNKGLTMLPNTANTPVPQQPQPQQPPAQGNISNVYAQSTLPQSHYMQPNQVI